MQRSVAVVSKESSRINIFKVLGHFVTLSTVSFMIMGFLLSRSILMASIAPLGVAFLTCMIKRSKYRLPVFAAGIAGTILSSNGNLVNAKYLVCMIALVLLSKLINKIDKRALLALVSAGMVSAISVGQVLYSSVTAYNLLLVLAEGVITFVAIFIFSYGVDLLTNIKHRMSVVPEEVISISLMIVFTIMGIGSMSILGISIRVVLSTILILVAAIIGGATMGASGGVIVGLAFMINNISSAIYMGVYAFSGLISGTFNKLNKFVCIIGYILSWLIMYTYTNGISNNLSQFKDILIASLVVLIIPEKVFSKIEKLFKNNLASNESVNDYVLRSKNITKNRLDSVQKTYLDIANTFDRIRERESVLNQRDIANIVDMIHNDECRPCSMRRMCWETRFNHTYTMICEILEMIEEKGEVVVDDIPKMFQKECMKPDEILKMSNYYYRLFALDYDWSVKLSESRKLIADQIRSISESIEFLSDDLEKNIILDLEKEKEIYENLERYGVDVESVDYMTKINDDVEIEIKRKMCIDGKLCDGKIKDALSEIVGEELSARKVGCNSTCETCKATFVKAQKFKAISDVSSISRDGHIFCGDNYTYMEINDGKYMMAISDGMGNGKKAYEESSITIDLLEKMIDSKIEDKIIVDTINNMLMLKSSDEMFSTLDLSIIDLKRGSMDTIKMGACSTYIKRKNGEVDFVSSSSLPVGILSDVNIDRKNVKVGDGDYVIMVSDGVVDAGISKNLGDNWLVYFLNTVKSTNPKQISNIILDRALEIQSNKIEDDMTVLVTKIILNK